MLHKEKRVEFSAHFFPNLDWTNDLRHTQNPISMNYEI